MRALLLLTIAIACTERHRFQIDAEPNDLIVIATVSAEGGTGEIRTAFGDELVVVEDIGGAAAWVLREGSFIDTNGDPIARPALTAGTSGIGCQRCMVEVEQAPKILIPGESCPLPSFAEGSAFQIDEGKLDALRRSILLSAPGECACQPPPLGNTVGFDVCPLTPQAAPIQGEEFALADDGSILAVNQGYAVRIDPAGAILTASFQPAKAPILSADFLPDGTGVIVSKGLGNIEGEWTLILPGGEVVSDRFSTLAPRQLARLRGADLFVVGHMNNAFDMSLPALEACDSVPPGGLRCESQTLMYEGRCNVLDDIFRGAAALATGVDVAASENGFMFLRPPDDDRWFCDSGTGAITFVDGLRTLELETIGRVFALGDRLFGCGLFNVVDGPDQVFAVFSGVVPALTSTGAQASSTYGIGFSLSAVVSGECGRFSRDGDTVLLSLDRRNDAYRFDSGGALLQYYDAIGAGGSSVLFAGEIAERTEELQGDSSKYMMAVAPSGAIYRRSNAGAFVPVYSASPPDIRRYRALAPFTGGAYAFSEDGTVRKISLGEECASTSVEEFAIDGLSRPGEFAAAAIPFVSRPNTYLVAFQHGEYSAFRVVDMERRIVEREQLASDFPGIVFFDGIEIAPSRFVFLSDTRVIQVDGDVAEIGVDYDDPLTSEIEIAPVPIRWKGIDSSNGVAWIVGRQAIARLVTRSDRLPRAEGYWLRRAGKSEYQLLNRVETPTFYAIDVRCPDDAVTLATERLVETPLSAPKSALTSWQLAPCSGDLRLCRYEGYDTGLRTAPDNNSAAIAVLESEGAPYFVFESGVVQQLGQPRTVLPFPDVLDAVRSDRGIIAGGSGGRLSAIIER